MASYSDQGRAEAAILAARLECIMARYTLGFIASDAMDGWYL